MPRPAAVFALLLTAAVAAGQDGNEKNESAIQAAVAAVAPSVVKIDTSGGTEMVGSGRESIRKGVGPTTGVVVGADGYVISSLFNFANKPTTIYVTVPGKPRILAKIVANDTTRMLTLLKVDLTGLPVPTALPKSEFKVGQWSVAVGRTLSTDDGPPSFSVGIISALGRQYGKAVQTDAKVSPVNYGGPLVGIDGRVHGVLIPASSRGEGDTAGVEWYDSGIGFAVPLVDVFAALPRLKLGKDLKKGLLGITPPGEDLYQTAAVVGQVSPDSAAAKAGMKTGDTITEIDRKPIANFSQLQHVLGPKYEGDVVSVKVLRDGKAVEFAGLTLTGAVTALATPFLGLLPMRDDPEPGMEVRYVFPDSPAAAAGIKTGDRVMKIGPPARGPGGPTPPMVAFTGRVGLSNVLKAVLPGQEIKLELKRKDGGKTETLTLKVAADPDTLPPTIPLESTLGRALEKPKPAGGAKPKEPKESKDEPKDDEPKKDEKPEDKKPTETGLLKRQNATLGREYWVYVPENYKPEVSHGVIVWLHPTGQAGKDADRMTDIWKQFCADQHYILIGPKSQNERGWVAGETEGVVADVKDVLGQYTVDRNRVIAHGMGTGGQMAFYMGFNARDVFRGVATTGAALGTQPKDNLPNQPLAFFVVAGQKDPLFPEIEKAKPALAEKRFPVQYRSIADFGKEYMDQKTLIEMCIWLDTLDRV